MLSPTSQVPYVCRALRVNPQKGISGTPEDMKKRKEEYGSNTYPEQPQKSFFVSRELHSFAPPIAAWHAYSNESDV